MRTAREKSKVESPNLKVAVVGTFQIGKSTFVNCLLGKKVAETGIGISTTHRSTSYAFSEDVTLVDTPGFDASGRTGSADVEEAERAIKAASLIVVYQDKCMEELCREIFKKSRETGKQALLIYNCTNQDNWAPEENEAICSEIAGIVRNGGGEQFVEKVNGELVFPINALWAAYGLGLPMSPRNVAKIVRYAHDDLDIQFEGDKLRRAILEKSKVIPLRQYFNRLPLEMLSNFAKSRKDEIKRFSTLFADELRKMLKDF